MIDVKLADTKLESSEAYLLKLGKNLWWDFGVIEIFRENAVLNICQYLKGFYTYKKNKYYFLKVPSRFIKEAKNHTNRLNRSKRESKTVYAIGI